MRIADLTIHKLSIPTGQQLRDPHTGQLLCSTTKSRLLLKLITDDPDLVGWGEGSGEWLVPAVEACLLDWRPLLIAADPLNIAALTDDITDRIPWKGGPVFGTAVAAINMALHDIAGKAWKVPVHSAVQSGLSNPAWGNVSSDRLGYDGAGRMIAKRYLSSTLNGSSAYSNTTALVGFTTEFDKASNKLFERHLHAENRSYLYNALDSMDRLREYQRGTLATGGATVASAITLPGTDSQRSYDLDGLGNWQRLSYTPVGGSPTTEVRQHNPLNQITKRASTSVSHDDNGNLTDDGARLLEYDALNRLKRVKNKSNSQTVGEYTYDAAGRRIRKVVTNGGITGTVPNGTTDYLYDQQQCVEERDGSNSHTKQFVWGTYIDELIQQKTYTTTGGGSLAAGTYYPLQDLHYRVIALTNSSGTIVESYDYDPYGKRQVYKDDGADAMWFTADDVTTDDASCEYGHQGLLHDEESALIYNRARMLQPTLGRFIQRDPMGYVDGMGLYEYVNGNIIGFRDPQGTVIIGEAPIEVRFCDFNICTGKYDGYVSCAYYLTRDLVPVGAPLRYTSGPCSHPDGADWHCPPGRPSEQFPM